MFNETWIGAEYAPGVGEMVMRTYHESQHKPTYAVAEALNFGEGGQA